jgi:hypothetical protein
MEPQFPNYIPKDYFNEYEFHQELSKELSKIKYEIYGIQTSPPEEFDGLNGLIGYAANGY